MCVCVRTQQPDGLPPVVLGEARTTQSADQRVRAEEVARPDPSPATASAWDDHATWSQVTRSTAPPAQGPRPQGQPASASLNYESAPCACASSLASTWAMRQCERCFVVTQAYPIRPMSVNMHTVDHRLLRRRQTDIHAATIYESSQSVQHYFRNGGAHEQLPTAIYWQHRRIITSHHRKSL